MTRSAARRLFILLPAWLLCACATPPSVMVKEYLDQKTGVTVTASITPMVLYRDNTSRAAYARNVLNIGPIEVNRSGNYQYFLWVGIWNTMGAEDVAQQRDAFTSITLFADGEPLPLEVAGWGLDTIGVSQPVYLKPVASAVDAYYPVTVDQVRLIARATDLRVRTSGTSAREYQPWGDLQTARRDFEAFLQRAFF